MGEEGVTRLQGLKEARRCHHSHPRWSCSLTVDHMVLAQWVSLLGLLICY